jgi:hypothetical protein
VSSIERDNHKIRVGYSQVQALLEAYLSDPTTSAFPDQIEAIAAELLEGDVADNLYHLLFGATLFNSLLLVAAMRGDLGGKAPDEILRVCGQVVNRQLDLDSGPG